MSDSEDRAEFVRRSIPFIMAITVEAHAMDKTES